MKTDSCALLHGSAVGKTFTGLVKLSVLLQNKQAVLNVVCIVRSTEYVYSLCVYVCTPVSEAGLDGDLRTCWTCGDSGVRNLSAHGRHGAALGGLVAGILSRYSAQSTEDGARYRRLEFRPSKPLCMEYVPVE